MRWLREGWLALLVVADNNSKNAHDRSIMLGTVL